jgi:hypothetical protein
MLLMDGAVVFLLKKIEDLLAFSFCFDRLQYESRHDLMTFAIENVAFAKMMRSFANRRCVMGGQFLAILMPLKRPIDYCWRNSLDNTSVPSINNNGDRGSPCRSSRV